MRQQTDKAMDDTPKLDAAQKIENEIREALRCGTDHYTRKELHDRLDWQLNRIDNLRVAAKADGEKRVGVTINL